MIEYMLDSDICIYLMADKYPSLNQRVAEAGSSLAISTVVLAELSFGVGNSVRREHNRRELAMLVERLQVLDFNASAAHHYGELRTHLQRMGTPVGPNDMLIGAHARSLDLTIVTNNRREFDRMPGLKIENWV